MLKKLIPLAAAAAIFVGGNTAYGQSHSCSQGAPSKCSTEQKCGGEKATETKKSEEVELSRITREQLNEMISAGNIIIIDARDAESYGKGHIDGAVNLVSYTLPENKDAAMIFYCGGPQCAAAPRAARNAMSLGYTNVKVFTGGWLEWNEGAEEGSQASL